MHARFIYNTHCNKFILYVSNNVSRNTVFVFQICPRWVTTTGYTGCVKSAGSYGRIPIFRPPSRPCSITKSLRSSSCGNDLRSVVPIIYRYIISAIPTVFVKKWHYRCIIYLLPYRYNIRRRHCIQCYYYSTERRLLFRNRVGCVNIIIL